MGPHTTERVGYVAVRPGNDTITNTGQSNLWPIHTRMEADFTGNWVTDEWYHIDFNRSYRNPRFFADLQTMDGTNTAGLRYRNLTRTGVDVFVEEEQSNDTETNHTTEDVGYMVIEGP